MIPLLTFAPTMSSCVLKRFLLTTGRNFVMSCVNRAFLLTGKIFKRWGGRIETSLCPLKRPAGVAPLEVRFAHPVRLAPATHSQGHGRPCLQSRHPRRGFSTTWSFHDVYSRGPNLAESQSGRGYGRICNLLVIRYYNGEGVETWPKKGCVSTPCFITY